jgi:predicted GNAT family N-acyltransferase
MTPPPNIQVRLADWLVERDILMALREEVFIREQLVPADLERDEFDPRSRHVVAIGDNRPIGTGRLTPDGHIGRMAVLRSWRRMGVGSALLTRLLDVARDLGVRRVMLNAQLQALPFYLCHGFEPEGDEFLEAGIRHRSMRRIV